MTFEDIIGLMIFLFCVAGLSFVAYVYFFTENDGGSDPFN